MTIYSYVITRDYGFAPNPFYGVCSLATCKPKIRKSATVGDWVLGFGSVAGNLKGKLIYAMKVDKKITFDEYWNAEEYRSKKPVMNGSLKQNYGDNMYHRENGEWKQVDSHHSLEGGEANAYNLDKDTGSNSVLLSTHFWYFGIDAIPIPEELRELIPQCRDYRKFDEEEIELQKWLESLPETGFIGEPAKFSESFRRYDGVS